MEQFYHLIDQLTFPLLFIVGIFVVSQALRYSLNYLIKRFHGPKHSWKNAFFHAIKQPLQLGIWFFSLIHLARYLELFNKDEYILKVVTIAESLVFVFLVAWLLFRFVKYSKTNYIASANAREFNPDLTFVDALGKTAYAIIFVMACGSILQIFDVSLTGLLAFSGAAGIAVGFAAQNLVANLFGGLTIYTSRIFKIGEDIIFPDSGQAGTVEEIGWRSTRILGWNGKRLYVPNSLFNTSAMVNNSRLKHRDLSEDILIHYKDMDKVSEIIAKGNEFLATREDLNYYVFRFDGVNEKAIRLNLYLWIQTVPAGYFVPYADFAKSKEEIMLKIMQIVREADCELVFPMSNVYLHNEGTA